MTSRTRSHHARLIRGSIDLPAATRRGEMIAGAIEGLVRHLRPEFDDEDERRMVATAAVEQFMLRVVGMARSWEQMFAEEVAKAMQRKVQHENRHADIRCVRVLRLPARPH
jgi:hypothetical protein